MRAWLQGVRHLAVVFGFVGLLSAPVRADPLYSVTNLGPANPSAAFLNGTNQLDPSGNYLGSLSAADQAAFQAGSFDVFAHPATINNLPSFDQGDVLPTNDSIGDDILERPRMVTSNNQGLEVGTATHYLPALASWTYETLALFAPNPHTVPDPENNNAPVQSPGHMFAITQDAPFNGVNFIGTVSGINDHGLVTTTQHNLITNYEVPFIQTYSSPTNGQPISLGNLGGSNGFANALNNSNQVVGWSQTASGAQHAFVYSNGTMQDLNLLIPTSANITLIDAVGIDGSGRIVAYGTDSSGQMDEFLLTPDASSVPEPSTLAVFGFMMAALAVRHVRSRPTAKSRPLRAATARPWS